MKLTKLLPIVSIAAVTSPMVTLCSCTPTIKLNCYIEHVVEKETETQIIPMLINKQPIDMIANKTYRFNVNIKDWGSDSQSCLEWGFVICPYYLWEDPYGVQMLSRKVWIDGKELKQVNKSLDFKPGTFLYKTFGKHYALGGFKSDIKDNSKIKLEIVTPDSHKNVHGIFIMTRVIEK